MKNAALEQREDRQKSEQSRLYIEGSGLLIRLEIWSGLKLCVRSKVFLN